jgi:hypothetical protein
MNPQDSIASLVNAYFNGVYRGDAEALRALFDGVAARKSPKELGEPYLMKTLAVDRLGSIASAKLDSPMLGFDYHLYLTLCLRADGWRIVNKTFTHLRDAHGLA